MKIRKNKNTITTKIKRSELLSKLRCLGGSSWCSEENFYTDLALEKVNTAIADLLSYQNLYGFYPEPDYEVKLTKRQMDLMFVFYSYINKGKFNDAYHELWDSIEKSWETYSEDDYLAYDELVAIYGLLFTFKLAVELAELKTSYQNIKEELENAKLRLNILECEEAEEQRALAKLFEERFDTESNLFFGDYEHRIIKDLLSGTLKINELCFAERTSNKSFYISALRFARVCENEEEYKQVLELLQSDIKHLQEGILKERLASVYDTYKDYNEDIYKLAVQSEHEYEHYPATTEKTYFDRINEEKNATKLLIGELTINELPYEERINQTIYYAAALKYSKDCENEEEYKKILNLLKSDINHISDEELKIQLEIFYDRMKSDYVLGD